MQVALVSWPNGRDTFTALTVHDGYLADLLGVHTDSIAYTYNTVEAVLINEYILSTDKLEGFESKCIEKVLSKMPAVHVIDM